LSFGSIQPTVYQLIAGGALLDAEAMPAALGEGSVVWGGSQRMDHHGEEPTERALL